MTATKILNNHLFVQIRHSVFRRAAIAAAFPSVLAVLIRAYPGWLPPEMIPMDSRNYSTFVSVLGFVLTFRTSQAYSRFWEGATLLNTVTSTWFDACMQVFSYSEASGAPVHKVNDFKAVAIRLWSLLHAAALQQVTVKHDDSFEVIDAQSLDNQRLESLKRLEERKQRTEVVFKWVNRLILDGINSGIITTPAPIVTRCFQELNSGLTALNTMTAITDTPFPIRYTQVLTVLLVIHCMITPFIIGGLEVHPIWTGIFSFVSVFSLLAMNLISSTIEQPFGDSENNFDLAALQEEMNDSLAILLRKDLEHMPAVNPERMQHALSTKSSGFVKSTPLSELGDRKEGRRASRNLPKSGIRTSAKEIRHRWTTGAAGKTRTKTWAKHRNVFRAFLPKRLRPHDKKSKKDKLLASLSSEGDQSVPLGEQSDTFGAYRSGVTFGCESSQQSVLYQKSEREREMMHNSSSASASNKGVIGRGFAPKDETQATSSSAQSNFLVLSDLQQPALRGGISCESDFESEAATDEPKTTDAAHAQSPPISYPSLPKAPLFSPSSRPELSVLTDIPPLAESDFESEPPPAERRERDAVLAQSLPVSSSPQSVLQITPVAEDSAAEEHAVDDRQRGNGTGGRLADTIDGDRGVVIDVVL